MFVSSDILDIVTILTDCFTLEESPFFILPPSYLQESHIGQSHNVLPHAPLTCAY